MTGFNFSLFDASTLVSALIVILITYIALFIPSMMVTGAKPEGVAKAISCCLWKTFGFILLSMSVVQVTISFIGDPLPIIPILPSLILLLVSGIGIMVHASRILSTVDRASRIVPVLVFLHTIEIIGGLMTVVSALSLMLNFLMTERIDEWQLPTTLILLGVMMMLSASLSLSTNTRPAKASKRK